jgi:hypothetical protein
VSIQAIQRYLKASQTRDSEPKLDAGKPKVKPRKRKQVYTIRDVIKENYRSQIDDQIPYKSGEPEYLGRFQAAVTAVLQNMSEEDLEEAENLVEQWNREGAPSELQLK